MRSLTEPIKPTGGFAILRGNIAPDGCVVKLAGHERRAHTGPARVFDGEEAAMAAVLAHEIQAGDVVVIRDEGPAGGPGMREMLAVTAALVGRGARRAGRADHRRALLRRHARVHGRPRRARGRPRRPIGALRDGDQITIDADARNIDVALGGREIAARLAAYTPPARADEHVDMAIQKYAKLVGSAAEGRSRAEREPRGRLIFAARR